MRLAPSRANHRWRPRMTDRQQSSASSRCPIRHAMGSSASSLRALWRAGPILCDPSNRRLMSSDGMPRRAFRHGPLESFSIDVWRVCHHL
jgi:hypothetical protein